MALQLETVGADSFRGAFAAAYAAHPHSSSLTAPAELELEDATCYLLEDDSAGYVITGGDARYLFSTTRGRGDDLVADAVRNGARTLDCFDGPLVTLYSRHGFEVARRVSNWHAGGPDVVFMVHEDSY